MAPLWSRPEKRVARRKGEGGREEETATRTIEGGLSFPKSRELFEVIQTREVVPHLPRWQQGQVAHFLFSGSPLTDVLQQQGARTIIAGYLGGARTGRSKKAGEWRFRGGLTSLPLKNNSLDWALLSAPALPATQIVPLLKELGRIVKPGGGGLFIDWHPYSGAVQAAVADRPAVDATEGLGLERYFKALRSAHLEIRELREAFIDASVRSLMESAEDKDWFDRHKRQPLALLISFHKA